MTNLEITMDNGIVMMWPLNNVLAEEIDDVISIHADNGFMITIPKDSVEEESHIDAKDIYETYDGIKIVLDYIERDAN